MFNFSAADDEDEEKAEWEEEEEEMKKIRRILMVKPEAFREVRNPSFEEIDPLSK